MTDEQSTGHRLLRASNLRWRGVVVAGLVAVVSAAGCATTGTADETRTRSARCVIEDAGGGEVVIETCIVEMGPAGTPRHIRLPVYETHTQTPFGELTYPFTFEVDVDSDKGLVIRLAGTSGEGPEAEPVPETPELGEDEEDPAMESEGEDPEESGDGDEEDGNNDASDNEAGAPDNEEGGGGSEEPQS